MGVVNFGKNLSMILEYLELSRAELSMLTGIKPSTISGWIRGEYYPKLEHYLKLANTLNICPSTFARDTETLKKLIDKLDKRTKEINKGNFTVDDLYGKSELNF